jgi:hypothetical protein
LHHCRHDELLQTGAHLDLELMANGAHPARANDQRGQGTPKKHDRALVVIDKDGHQSTLIIPPALLVAHMHACLLPLPCWLVTEFYCSYYSFLDVVALGKNNNKKNNLVFKLIR